MSFRRKPADPIDRAIDDLDRQITTLQRQLREMETQPARAPGLPRPGAPETFTQLVKDMLVPPRRSLDHSSRAREDLFDVKAEPLKELEAEPIAFANRPEPDLFAHAPGATTASATALETAQVVPPHEKLAHYLGAGSIKSYKPLKHIQRKTRESLFHVAGIILRCAMDNLVCHTVIIQTKLGAFRAQYTPRGVSALEFPRRPGPRSGPPIGTAPSFVRRLAQQLQRYANGRTVRWSVPVDLSSGTDFQKKVWRTLTKIPRGQTQSYAWVARKIGKPNATRAVGTACGANPVPVVIPCHRVIASDGSLGGFGGGLPMKRRLLALEQAAWKTR